MATKKRGTGSPAISNEESLLTPYEAARLFRVDPKTIARWAETGKIPSTRTLGGHHRYPASRLRELMNELTSPRIE